MSNPVLAALGDTLVGKEGNVSTAEALKGKSVLGLYFSAHWCPPCRGFTPVLSEKYTALKKAGKDFELVFVSSDRNQAAFDEYQQRRQRRAVRIVRNLRHSSPHFCGRCHRRVDY